MSENISICFCHVSIISGALISTLLFAPLFFKEQVIPFSITIHILPTFSSGFRSIYIGIQDMFLCMINFKVININPMTLFFVQLKVG